MLITLVLNLHIKAVTYCYVILVLNQSEYHQWIKIVLSHTVEIFMAFKLIIITKHKPQKSVKINGF